MDELHRAARRRQLSRAFRALICYGVVLYFAIAAIVAKDADSAAVPAIAALFYYVMARQEN